MYLSVTFIFIGIICIMINLLLDIFSEYIKYMSGKFYLIGAIILVVLCIALFALMVNI